MKLPTVSLALACALGLPAGLPASEEALAQELARLEREFRLDTWEARASAHRDHIEKLEEEEKRWEGVSPQAKDLVSKALKAAEEAYQREKKEIEDLRAKAGKPAVQTFDLSQAERKDVSHDAAAKVLRGWASYQAMAKWKRSDLPKGSYTMEISYKTQAPGKLRFRSDKGLDRVLDLPASGEFRSEQVEKVKVEDGSMELTISSVGSSSGFVIEAVRLVPAS